MKIKETCIHHTKILKIVGRICWKKIYATRIFRIFFQQVDSLIVAYFRATWRTFQPKLEKKKSPSRKKFHIFQEMELLNSNTEKNQEIETPKKIPYILGNGNS